VAYLENHFYPIVIERLSRALQAHGYHVMLFMTEPGRQDEVMSEILQYKMDGVVLASVTLSSHVAEECANIGVPVVLFNRYIPDSHVSSVTSNNELGGRLVAELFAEAKHKRIAFIAGTENSSTNNDREVGFKQGLANVGLSVWKRVVGMYSFEGATLAARELLTAEEKPDAIFVANDHMAFAVMDVIRSEFGLRIPEDISVVGYDNVPEADWAAYSLTTVEQPVEAMIEETVNILIKQMEHKEVIEVHKVTDARLIERGSVRSKRSS
jgi:DNA-binding LacI/PurR family transcriptional regulator